MTLGFSSNALSIPGTATQRAETRAGYALFWMKCHTTVSADAIWSSHGGTVARSRAILGLMPFGGVALTMRIGLLALLANLRWAFTERVGSNSTLPFELQAQCLRCWRVGRVIRTAICSLFCARGPSAITRFVMAVVIDSIERQSLWAWSHVIKEVRKRCLPFIAYGDASTSVACIRLVGNSAAPLLHRSPYVVERMFWQMSARQSVDCFHCERQFI